MTGAIILGVSVICAVAFLVMVARSGAGGVVSHQTKTADVLLVDREGVVYPPVRRVVLRATQH